jgi:hypothetical protein
MELLNSAEQALDTKEVPLRMAAGVFDQERGVAATQLHLQWL